MRRADAKHRRAARKQTLANPRKARELCSCAFTAKRRY